MLVTALLSRDRPVLGGQKPEETEDAGSPGMTDDLP